MFRFYIFTENIKYLPHIKLYLFKIVVKLVSFCLLLLFNTVSSGLFGTIHITNVNLMFVSTFIIDINNVEEQIHETIKIY